MKNNQNIQKMVVLAMLLALSIVLQAIARFMPALSIYALPLGLIPVAVAAIVYGPKEGMLIGFLWGAFINLTDPDCHTFYNWADLNRGLAIFYTIIAVAGRGALDGLFIGLVYKGLMALLSLFIKKENKSVQITIETIATMLVSFLMLLFNNVVFYTCLKMFFAVNWPALAKFFSLNLAISIVVSIITAPIMSRVVLVSTVILNTENNYEHKEEESTEDSEKASDTFKALQD
jgi:uncharacterized membrane protein